jgi:mono/diheme cytochrome c family protein|nr:c-type cytochrome [Candidatus Krumholzibacteria bacterium]
MIRRAFLVFTLPMALLAGCSDEGQSPVVPGPGTEAVSFAQQIQPIFDASCVGCHGLGGNAGLDLRPGFSHANLVGVAAQASSGTLVAPSNSGASVLLNRLIGNGLGLMPPSGALGPSTLDLVTQWIDEGAPDN